MQNGHTGDLLRRTKMEGGGGEAKRQTETIRRLTMTFSRIKHDMQSHQVSQKKKT